MEYFLHEATKNEKMSEKIFSKSVLQFKSAVFCFKYIFEM